MMNFSNEAFCTEVDKSPEVDPYGLSLVQLDTSAILKVLAFASRV